MYLYSFHYPFSGAPLDGSVNGVQLTQHALTNEVGSVGSIFVAIAILLFAFSSIIGNYYYGEANIRFVTQKRSVLFTYRLLVGGMVMFGALASLDLAWSLADITMGLMTICNLIAISLLSRQAFLLLKDYIAQKQKGIIVRFSIRTVSRNLPTKRSVGKSIIDRKLLLVNQAKQTFRSKNLVCYFLNILYGKGFNTGKNLRKRIITVIMQEAFPQSQEKSFLIITGKT